MGESREGLRECSLYILVPEVPPGGKFEQIRASASPDHAIRAENQALKFANSSLFGDIVRWERVGFAGFLITDEFHMTWNYGPEVGSRFMVVAASSRHGRVRAERLLLVCHDYRRSCPGPARCRWSAVRRPCSSFWSCPRVRA